MRYLSFFVILVLTSVLSASAITIGAGPTIGTDKRGTVWYEEFQDWEATDLRALDSNSDGYLFNDGSNNSARDMIAFYSHDDGNNLYFRIDFFDLLFGEENGEVDVYIAIDCASGGQEWLPDMTDTQTAYPWEVCVAVYNASAAAVYDHTWGTHNDYFLGSYWRNDLDAVEFGIPRSLLIAQGWDGTSTINFQPFLVRDGTDVGGAGNISGESDVVDCIGNLTRDRGDGVGVLESAVASDASTSRAKYAAIAHANQSVNKKTSTQDHIYYDYDDEGTLLVGGFVRMIDSAEMLDVPVNLHISGTLLMSFLWATQDPTESNYPYRDGPTFLQRVADFTTNGPGSLIGGVLAEHIMTYFEGEVNAKSIQQNSQLIEHLFGLSESDMKVMHTPERVIRSDTNSAYVGGNGPLDGKTFEEIESSGFTATYLDEVTHLHWWFYPEETNNPGWDNDNWGRWAGGQGNDEEPYQHKIHKINGVLCFMINDREDQSKFGNDDGGMLNDTRYTLLHKAMQNDASQITIVFDDWEAFAGKSFASSVPNNNPDQWHSTLRWAANHPWIQIVNLKDVTEWALGDPTWIIDHGYVYDKSSQTYEWLKHASEQSYDHWYYGFTEDGARGFMEEDFFNRTPPVHNGWAPDDMKRYGDMNHTNTLIRDSWDTIQTITSSNLLRLAEWSYSAMIYETAWHDENQPAWWPPQDKPWLSWSDAYQSRNYQATFDRADANSYKDDQPTDYTSGWATKLHAHVRDMGVLKAASDWVEGIRDSTVSGEPTAYQRDIDDDTLDEYVLYNNRIFLCFERWGGRLIKAFLYDSAGNDAIAVIGVPIANPASESEEEWSDSPRCSALKDHWSTGQSSGDYIDMDYTPSIVENTLILTSTDGLITKTITLQDHRDVATVEYDIAPSVGTLYIRNGLGPNQFDLMLNGQDNLSKQSDGSFVGLQNINGGGAYLIAGHNLGINFDVPGSTGWEARNIPLVEVFECYNLDAATNFSFALAFSTTSAADLDNDGLANTNETAIGTNHELADTDNDGMRDGYEVANHLNPVQDDAQHDDDDDGASNVHEYIAGTDPQDASSTFAALPTEHSESGVCITTTTIPEHFYQIYFADNTSGFTGELTWNTFVNTNNGYGSWFETNQTPSSHTFIDDYSGESSGTTPHVGRFYRIKVITPRSE